MASPAGRANETPDASLEIPTEWLMPGLDLETVREAQRPGDLHRGYHPVMQQQQIGRFRALAPVGAETDAVERTLALCPQVAGADFQSSNIVLHDKHVPASSSVNT